MRRRVPAILLIGAAATAGALVVRRVLRERAELAARRQAWATGQAPPAQLGPAPLDDLAGLRDQTAPAVPVRSAPVAPIETVAVVNPPATPPPVAPAAPPTVPAEPGPPPAADDVPAPPDPAPAPEGTADESVPDHLDQVRKRLASIRVDGAGDTSGGQPAGVTGRGRRARAKRLPRWIEPDEGGGCGDSHPIKVKLRSGLFHLPGMLAYERTHADRCYHSSTDAETDGFERAKR